MRNTRAALILALAGTLAGCDETTMGPSADRAEARVTVQGDDQSGSTATSPEDDGTYSSTRQTEGQVEVRARVYVQTSAGSWVELTRGAAEQTVDASGKAGTRVLATTQLGTGAYNRVRVEFEHVRANMASSLQVSTGLLQGSVTVDAGSDGKVVVEREVAFQARAATNTELRINLNAEQWVAKANAATHTTAEAAFQSAVMVTAH